MARPRTISDEQILEGARELFLARGPSIPTAEIARRVGISEGLIFKRFPTKHALFLAAMGVKAPPWGEILDELGGQGDLKQSLQLLATQILEYVRDLLPSMMLVWSCRGELKEDLRALHAQNSPPRKNLDMLTGFFRREVAAGRLRSTTDPEVVARIFFGAIWNMVFMETIGQVSRRARPVEFAGRLVNTLWEGIAPLDGTEHGTER